MDRKELERQLRAVEEPAPPSALRDRLDSGIPGFAERPETRTRRGSWTMIKVGSFAGAAAALALLVAWIGLGPGGAGITLAGTLQPVLEATQEVRAVHLVLRMLTRAGEDFPYVHLDGSPRTVEAWIEWPRAAGQTGRARVDKADRVYVFDGTRTVFYHPERNEAYAEDGRGFGHQLFWPASWLRRILARPVEGVEILEHDEDGLTGRLLIREAGGEIDPLEPSFLGDFDRETEIVWDLDTHLLLELRRWVLVDGERKLFTELVSVDYLPAIDDAVFALELPDDVRWGGVPQGPASLLELGPREVALRLFEAAIEGDRAALELLCPSPAMVDWLLDERHRPSEVLFVGEPFRAGDYPGVYVPYGVRFGDDVKRYNLALRNDNAQRRWLYDGGI